MKRARDSTKNAEAGPSSSSGRGRSKRSKIQACTSCRRHKTRCEILDSFVDGVVRCHRCKVLNATCSYEAMDKALFVEQPPSPSSASSERGEAFLSSTTGVFTRRPSTSSAASLDTALDDPFPRADVMWSFIPQSLDWSTPMAALQELCKQTELPPPPSLLLVQDQSIADILTRNEEEHLLSMYAPFPLKSILLIIILVSTTSMLPGTVYLSQKASPHSSTSSAALSLPATWTSPLGPTLPPVSRSSPRTR